MHELGTALLIENQHRIQVPFARDGTCFYSGLKRNGRFTVGEKKSEKHFESFDEALAYLGEMKIAAWRRPNSIGNWGIVSAVKWGDLPLELCNAPAPPLVEKKKIQYTNCSELDQNPISTMSIISMNKNHSVDEFYKEKGCARQTVIISIPHKDELKKLSKKEHLTIGEVIEVLLDHRNGDMGQHFEAKRESKGIGKTTKTKLIKKMKDLTPEQLKAIEAIVEGRSE